MAVKKWYVLHVYSQHEDKVKESILKIAENNGKQDEIGEVYLPKRLVVEIDAKGNKREKWKTVTPGYLYVNLNLNEEVWHLIKGIDGVTGFLGERPSPLRRGEVEKLKKSLEVKTPEKVSNWKKDDKVVIKNGSFENYDGYIESVSDNKVKVIINFFDRPTPVELDFDDIERYLV